VSIGVRDHEIAPLAAGDPGEASGAGALFGQARDGMDDFLADRLAVAVVAVAADPGDAGDVGEVQFAGIGDPGRRAATSRRSRWP
jgi:hypothetical protein